MVSLYPPSFAEHFAGNNTPQNADTQSSPRLYICLLLITQTANHPAERLDHHVVYHPAIAKRSRKGCPVPDWKDSRSEIASHFFLVLELRCKFYGEGLRITSINSCKQIDT